MSWCLLFLRLWFSPRLFFLFRALFLRYVTHVDSGAKNSHVGTSDLKFVVFAQEGVSEDLPFTSRTCVNSGSLNTRWKSYTAQPALWQGFCGIEGSLWRTRPRVCAGRQEHESGRTSWSETWTSCPTTVSTTAGWKSSLTGFPLFGGAQLAIETTLVSALRRDGIARPQADRVDGVAAE